MNYCSVEVGGDGVVGIAFDDVASCGDIESGVECCCRATIFGVVYFYAPNLWVGGGECSYELGTVVVRAIVDGYQFDVGECLRGE